MRYMIEAACGCNKGKIRANNEDNFYFDGRCLEQDNNGLKNPAYMEGPLKPGLCVAVFDGMGGENFGEVASYTAARSMQQTEKKLADYFIPERKYMNDMCLKINEDVVAAAKELLTDRMGTTVTALYFSSRSVYVCNLGDSRAYRLRSGEFLQISQDHVEQMAGEGGYKKAPLTQYLGIDPEEVVIEPHIAKGEIKRGDQYLVCSDGLTDMLTNLEIYDIMSRCVDTEECVEELIKAALERGGKDNVTVILCRVF